MKTALTRNNGAPIVFRKDSIQEFRFYAQLFSSAISVWIGVQFYFWLEMLQAGQWSWLERPPGVEAYLPIGSLVSLRHWIESGVLNTIHPAGVFIFLAILLVGFVFKKGFCGWICPVGFVHELLGDIADKLWKRRLKPPGWLDWSLRMLKYLILGFFVWAVLIKMTPESIEIFIGTDYNQITDILMLHFFTKMTFLVLVVIIILFIFAFIVRGFWCRYLCPYGALLGLIGLFSPTRIRRDEKACIDCSSCATVCPTFIKVDKIDEVISDECIGCMACVDSCPVPSALQVNVVTKTNRVSKTKWAAILIIVFWGGLFCVKMFGPWENSITDAQYQHHLKNMETKQYGHP